MVFQSYALFNHMTVSENIKFGLQVRGGRQGRRQGRGRVGKGGAGLAAREGRGEREAEVEGRMRCLLVLLMCVNLTPPLHFFTPPPTPSGAPSAGGPLPARRRPAGAGAAQRAGGQVRGGSGAGGGEGRMRGW
jgi:hypothetical protein